MAKVPEERPYEGSGTGGKFRKRPFRRTQTTPYDRPPTAQRNPNRNKGWLSKIVDPAQRLITSSAHSLFSSVFRKRLPPPPPHPPPSEAEQEVRDNQEEEATFVANDSSGKQQEAVGESDVQIICSDGGGLTELEKLLRQKTFTRSEIEHLTALMRSRTVDPSVREEEKRTKMVPSEPTLPCEQKQEYPKTPAPENGIENHLVLTPYVTSSVPNEDVASPVGLAKAYMGSRPSKVSASVLGLQSPTLREDPTLLKSQNFVLKSPVMSIVPRANRHAGVHENGFLTPRSRGRSAIYSMARTPYARNFPTSTVKGVGLAVQGEPSSSAQSALDHDMLSASKQGALKRRSSVLDNDIGSVGPIRRFRHKSNILHSKGLNLPLSGSPLSIARSGVGVGSTQQTSSCKQKPILLDGVKHSHMKLLTENVDDTIHSMSFPPLPSNSKSSEMASKILQQLDKLVSSKEKSSELMLQTVNNKSPTKLSPSMLCGQALRSMETVDSSKSLDNTRDSKLDSTLGNLTASASKLTSQIDKVENGPLKLAAPSGGLFPVVTDADATIPRNQIISSAKSVDFSIINPVSYPPQKKRAFHMSAHEDYLDLDDHAYPNGAVSSFSSAEKEATGSTPMAEKTTSGTEAFALEKPSALLVVMPSESFTTDGKTSVGTADKSMVGKVDVSASITSSIPDTTFKPATAATQTILGSNKPASPNGSIANHPLFNFGNKMVSSTELTAADAPTKESMEAAPIFGLANIVSSKEQGADAPLLNIGINKNVAKVPQMPFNSSSSVGGESAGLKFGASSNSKLGTSISSTTVTGTDLMPKVLESDNADAKTNIETRFCVRSSEPAVSSAASTSLLTTPTSIFTFGRSSNQSNGPLPSIPPFSSPFPSLVTNNLASQNMFSSPSLAASSSIIATAASTSTSLTTSTPTIIASSNSSSSSPVVASSSSTTSFFNFESSPLPSTGLPLSSTELVSEPVEMKSRQDSGIGNLSSTAFGSSSAAVGSKGSGIFGFSSSAMTTVKSQSQGSVFGSSSGSLFVTQASPATIGFATSTQSQSVPFGSSASSPLSGLAENTTFSSGSLSFTSSTPATSIFNSGTTFELNTSASSTAANSVSSHSGTSSTLFGLSSWQPSKSPFSSAFSSSSSSGFSFGTSTASVSSASSPTMLLSSTGATSPQILFPSAAATASTQPASQFSLTSAVANTSPPPAQFSFTSAATTTSTQHASQFSFTSAATCTSTQPTSQFSLTSAAATTSPQPASQFSFTSAATNISLKPASQISFTSAATTTSTQPTSQFSLTSAAATTSPQPAPQFSFPSAGSTTSGQPASQFSFTSAAATTSMQPASQFSFNSAAATTATQSHLGSPNPVFRFGSPSASNDQMNMEDSMAEDTIKATPPATPIFGQQPAPLQSNFVFGASTPSEASPFQFGNQQNIAPQNPSPFQASGSLEFNAGGSFSLGTGGGDKSGRKFVKVKHKLRKK